MHLPRELNPPPPKGPPLKPTPTPPAKHTPGPWMQGPTSNTWNKVYSGEKGKWAERAICTINPIHAQGARQKGDFDEEEANARLIAAAPALLIELKNTVAAIEKWGKEHPESGGWIGVIHGALKAIAQAEGGAQ